MAPGDNTPDHEGIVLLPDGTFAVAAEGTDREPRLPPAINIYGRHGDFVRRLADSRQVRTRADGTGDARRAGQCRIRRPDALAGWRASVHRDRDGADSGRSHGDVRCRSPDANHRIRPAPRDVRAGAGIRLRPRAGAEAAVHCEPALLHQRAGRAAGDQPHDAAGARAWIRRERGERGAEPQSHPVVQSQPDRRDRCLAARVAQGASGGRPGHQDAAAGFRPTSRGSAASSRQAWTISKAWRSAPACRTGGRRSSSSATTTSASCNGRGFCCLRYSNGVRLRRFIGVTESHDSRDDTTERSSDERSGRRSHQPSDQLRAHGVVCLSRDVSVVRRPEVHGRVPLAPPPEPGRVHARDEALRLHPGPRRQGGSQAAREAAPVLQVARRRLRERRSSRRRK